MTIQPGQEIIVGQRLRAVLSAAQKGKAGIGRGIARGPGEDRMRILLVGLLLVSALRSFRPRCEAVVPSQASAAANRFYSPGVDAGDYVYVSGQGPRRPDGSLPATFAAQVRQALDNVKSVVEAAGLTMEHVVYTQVYLEDISKYGEMNEVFAQVFREDAARTSGARRGQASRLIDSDQCRRGTQSGGAAGGVSRRATSPDEPASRRAFSPATGCFVSGMLGQRSRQRQSSR